MANPEVSAAPEGWAWVETRTPGEVRLMRLGTGYPTLCLLDGNLTVIDPREPSTRIPKAALDALLDRARSTRPDCNDKLCEVRGHE